MKIWDRIRNTARPGDTALINEKDGSRITYEQLNEYVQSVAGLVGEEPGTVIATVFNISVESLILLLGLSLGGATVMPLNPESTEAEFTYFFSRNVSRVYIPESTNRDSPVVRAAEKSGLGIQIFTLPSLTSRSPPRRHPSSGSDVAIILFTSGTTANPKAVPLTHNNILSSLDNILQVLPLSREDTTMCVMPLFHVHGIVACVLTALCSGGTCVIPTNGKFSASKFFQSLENFECTWFTAVPTIHQILLQRSDDYNGKLRFIRSSSSKLFPSILAQMERKYKVPVIECYGMTETSYQICSNPCDWSLRVPGSVGVPHGSVRIKIENGIICVSGPTVTGGYLGNTEANDSSFFKCNEGIKWFKTGDVGFIDPQTGFLAITGRAKEQINRGGEKISPNEIDVILKSFPFVSEAVAFGFPDPLYGECVAVAIAPARAEQHKDELIRALTESLAKFKHPTRWFFLESIPKTATGKVRRTELPELLG